MWELASFLSVQFNWSALAEMAERLASDLQLSAEQREQFERLWQPGRRGVNGARRPSGNVKRH